MDTPLIISLDNEASWPSELLALLEQKFPALQAYENNRRQIDQQTEKDLVLRFNPPSNPYHSIRDEVLTALWPHSLIGYHCTRLHQDEILSVREGGLQPLSLELLQSRIKRRVEASDISSDTAERLLIDHQAQESNRSGMIWLIFSCELLHSELGVGRFFRSWGGEALYNSHEDDEKTGLILRSLGVPCIVEAAVPISEIRTSFPIEEKFLQVYLHHRSVNTGHDSEMEGYITMNLLPSHISRIIQVHEPEFVQLTSCDTWREQPDA